MATFLIAKGLQSAYTALNSKSANTIYVCTDSGNMYLGETPLFEEGAFTGASLSGKVITFTKKDGNSTTVNLSTFALTTDVTAVGDRVTTLETYVGTDKTDGLGKKIADALAAAQAAQSSANAKVARVSAANGITVAGTATAPTVAVKAANDTITVNASGVAVNATKFDAAGSANAAKSAVIGSASDASSASTIYGAKKYADEKIAAQIASTYRYKGTCAYADLPSEGNVIGDVWNVEDAHGNVPAGTNWAWNGTAWDALAGEIDLSPYAKTADVASTYATKSALSTLESKVTANTTAISTLNGAGEGSVSKSISDAIGALDKTDSVVSGQVVSAVSQTNGIITVSRRALVAADIPSLATSKITGLDAALAGKVPTTRTVNKKALSDNIVLGGADIALTGYVKGSSSAAIAATDTVNAAIAKLEVKVDAAAASGVQSLTSADKSLTINPNSGAVTAKVALSATSDNELTLGADGLYVQPMQWGSF